MVMSVIMKKQITLHVFWSFLKLIRLTEASPFLRLEAAKAQRHCPGVPLEEEEEEEEEEGWEVQPQSIRQNITRKISSPRAQFFIVLYILSEKPTQN